MWIFSKYGFFSVTQHAKRRDNIQVRARTKTDLEALKLAFPPLDRSPIIETPQADYRWRLIVQRWKWEIVGAHLVADIDYGNFKGKMATIPEQLDKLPMLHDIWNLHHRYQERKSRPDPFAGHPELFNPHDGHLFDEDEMAGASDHDVDWHAEAEASEAAKGNTLDLDPFADQARQAAENTRQRDARRKGDKPTKGTAPAGTKRGNPRKPGKGDA